MVWGLGFRVWGLGFEVSGLRVTGNPMGLSNYIRTFNWGHSPAYTWGNVGPSLMMGAPPPPP